jgi:hypothetical protein
MANLSFLILMVAFICVAIGFVITSFIWNTIYTPINNVIGSTNPTSATVLTNTGSMVNLGDGILMMVIIFIGIAEIASAFTIRTHPVFFVIMIIMNVVLIMLSDILANVFATFANTSTFASTMTTFPYITVVISNLPLVCTVLSAVIAIVTYSQGRQALR